MKKTELLIFLLLLVTSCGLNQHSSKQDGHQFLFGKEITPSKINQILVFECRHEGYFIEDTMSIMSQSQIELFVAKTLSMTKSKSKRCRHEYVLKVNFLDSTESNLWMCGSHIGKFKHSEHLSLDSLTLKELDLK